ncbi:MAG: helix-turn-helix domain-containing protein [Clostridium sp.]|nr:helix-turn-helix domain-containing protein [Clostridium sp.]
MQENKWLSMKEVCVYLRISRDTVMNWIKKEGMPAHQKGRLWRFDVNEVDEWMKNNNPENISDAKEFLD